MKHDFDEADKVISDEDIYQFIFDENGNIDDDVDDDISDIYDDKKNNAINRPGRDYRVNTNAYDRAGKDRSDRPGGANRLATGGRRNYGSIDRDVRRPGRTKERSSGRRRGGGKVPEVVSALGTYIFFPVMFIYLEIVFHIFMEKEVSKYALLYILFAIPLGLIISIFTTLFNRLANKIITYVLTIAFCILFAAEVVLRDIFAMYTQIFSIMEIAGQVADDNYLKVALESILGNIFPILFVLLPILFIFTVGRKCFDFRRKDFRLTGIFAGIAVAVHLFALLCLRLPWELSHGTYQPKELYKMDTYVEEQVNKLGVLTMLRLDVKHTIFGVSDKERDNSNVTIPVIQTKPGDSTPDTSSEGTTEEPVDRSPNIMNIDFDALIANTSNSDIKWMHEFVSRKNADGSYAGATNKNEYTGMFKDYNIIFITAEGFSKYCIIPELMPTLHRLSTEGFVFENFYTALHYTSTSGGEFQNLTGMYPKNGNPVSMTESGKKKTNMYFSLARQLNRIGYTSIGYHNNGNMYGRDLSHPNLGYNWKYGGNGFTMETSSSGKSLWPQSDLYMMEQTVDEYINSETPFNVYYLTVSGHVQYNFSGNAMSIKNKEAVDNLPYSETTKAYVACNLELEKAMAYLVQRLEDAGIADKTLIVLSPDHIPYFNAAQLEELAGQSFGGEKLDYLKESDVNFDIYKNTLIMWSASIKEPIKVDKVCCQVDILPTISNLMGLEYDSRLLMGSDILSDSPGLVIFTSNSWKSDIGLYNVYTKKFTLNPGLSKDVYTDDYISEYVKAMNKIVRNKLDASVVFVANNYYNSIFPN